MAPTSRKVALIAVHHVRADGHVYTGGAEKYIVRVIEALLSSGVSAIVGYSGTSIYQSLPGVADERLMVERVDWLDEKLSGDGYDNSTLISARQGWFEKSAADTAFFVQQASGAAFGASVLAAKSLGLRVVSTIRQAAAELPGRPGFLGSIPFSWRRRAINRVRIPATCCDAIIFNSERVAAGYQRDYQIQPDRCRVICNAEAVHSDALAERRFPPITIGTVGRISSAKGADLLLDAFAGVAKEMPALRLVYFGDGPELPVLRSRAQALELADRVEFRGYVEERDAIYREIDLYVQASRRESMSNSVLEAMARGIPCIVSHVGGLPELVLDGVTGRVVAPDAGALAGAIRELVRDPYTCRRFGEAGLERVREAFGVERFREQTLKAILG